MDDAVGPWQDYNPKERMEYLLKTGHLSDCSFVVYDNEGKKVVLKCHKFVLMSVSPVFERMFEGDFEEAKIPENIVLDDVTDGDFKKFVEYLYWHDNQQLESYDLQTLQTLIYLSKKFMVSFCTENCLNVINQRLSRGMDADLTLDLFEYGHQIDADKMINIILKSLQASPQRFLKAAAVFDLSSEVFYIFITKLKGVALDRERFSLIERYCQTNGLVGSKSPIEPTNDADNNNNKHADSAKVAKLEKQKEELNITHVNEENKDDEIETNQETPREKEKPAELPEQRNEKKRKTHEQFIFNLLDTIEFSKMTPYDFCAGPGASDLLTIEKKYEILSSIVISQRKHTDLRFNKC